MNRKTILVLSHEFPPFGGGGGAVIESLCLELSRRGYDPEVWTSGIPANLRLNYPFTVRYFSTPRTSCFETNYPAILIYTVKVILAGLAKRKRFRPSLVFSNMTIPSGVPGVILGFVLGAKHLTWHHGAEVHGNHRSHDAPLLFRITLRWIWKRTAFNFFVSRSLLQRARNYGDVPRSVILPVAVKEYPVLKHTAKDTRGKLFLFAGRLEPVKNPLLFLNSALDILQRNSCPEARFFLVGSGSMYRSVQAKTGTDPRIVICQSISREQLQRYFAEAYVFVLPSEVEGFPLTILEAAQQGVPAIGSDTGGIKDALHHGKTGLLFHNGSCDALIAAIERLYHDEPLRNRLGKAASQLAAQYTIGNSADIFLKHC